MFATPAFCLVVVLLFLVRDRAVLAASDSVVGAASGSAVAVILEVSSCDVAKSSKTGSSFLLFKASGFCTDDATGAPGVSASLVNMLRTVLRLLRFS